MGLTVPLYENWGVVSLVGHCAWPHLRHMCFPNHATTFRKSGIHAATAAMAGGRIDSHRQSQICCEEGKDCTPSFHQTGSAEELVVRPSLVAALVMGTA